MKYNIRWARTFGLNVSWDYITDKEILIFLPFIVIILNFGKCS
tara:strand:- start:2647 stop:2775 length:129 start_codon:yes stop_codon:yes gene_type:complete